MNYIKSLQAKVADLEQERAIAQADVDTFLAYLHSDKFKGSQIDGERKDWISTGDVINWLRSHRLNLLSK